MTLAVAASAYAALLLAWAVLAMVWLRQRRLLRQVATAATRMAGGEAHIYAPLGGGRDVEGVAAAVNRLGDALRAHRLQLVGERVYERALLRESPNGLLVVDAQHVVRVINPVLTQLLPIDGDAVGRDLAAAIAVPELVDAFAEAGRTRALSERTVTIGHRDLLLRAFPTADGEGCMGVVLDITSVKLAERSRRDFVANVSHELRTPITAIMGYAETLLEERDQLTDPAATMLDAINRNARRLGDLVEDVLQLSRIEASNHTLPLESEPVAPLVRQVADRYRDAAARKHLRLVVDPLPDVTAELNSDAFDHALANLVDNAMKYTDAGGAITLSVRAEDGLVAVAVSDSGIGIAREHHERIFERFYRVDAARSRAAGGTGLGLALVKHLCRAMAGDVTVESAPARGSTFTLRLNAYPNRPSM